MKKDYRAVHRTSWFVFWLEGTHMRSIGFLIVAVLNASSTAFWLKPFFLLNTFLPRWSTDLDHFWKLISMLGTLQRMPISSLKMKQIRFPVVRFDWQMRIVSQSHRAYLELITGLNMGKLPHWTSFTYYWDILSFVTFNEVIEVFLSNILRKIKPMCHSSGIRLQISLYELSEFPCQYHPALSFKQNYRYSFMLFITIILFVRTNALKCTERYIYGYCIGVM